MKTEELDADTTDKKVDRKDGMKCLQVKGEDW
jgi:hypothetical protein